MKYEKQYETTTDTVVVNSKFNLTQIDPPDTNDSKKEL